MVAVAALLFSPFASKTPSKEASLPVARPPVTAQALPSSGAVETPETLSRDDRGPWYALCQEFAGDEHVNGQQQMEEVGRTTTDKDGQHKFDVRKPVEDHLKPCKGSSADFQFLIATVPDPIGSHLDVEFDRALQSLLLAAAVREYSFERYWLPWRPGQAGAVAETGSATVLRTEERLRQEQPGLLVFRKLPAATTKSSPGSGQSQPKQDKFLLIFLVGETPTAGLNRPAFLKSLRYIEELTPPANAPPVNAAQQAPSPSLAQASNPVIRIVGPIFSDTLPPLADAIVDYSTDPHRINKPIFRVVNYGARSHDLIEGFKETLPNGSTFYSLDLEVAQAQVEWVDYLCSLGYQTSEMAVLAEDLSPHNNEILSGRQHAAGFSVRKSHCGAENATDVLSLGFPRDLSSIRNATESDNSNPEPQQIAGVNIPSIGVALTLRQDESNEHDAPPDFAQMQSSARVDRALRALVKALRNRRIQAVLVTATNPLDRIFLLDYLHLTAPDVRLATVGADDFMLARPQHIDLSGTLAVTSLPLTETTVSVETQGAQPNVSGPPNRISLNFPSNASEGVFLAATNLLGPRPQFETNLATGNCADISIVGKTGFRPAVMEGRKRLYPCFDSNTDRVTPSVTIGRSDDSATPAAPASPAQNQESLGITSNPIPFVWIMALISLMIAAVVHLGLVCSSNNWLGLGFFHKVSRLTISDSGVREVQLFFLLVATEQILLLEWIAATTTSALIAQAFPYQLALFGAHVVLLVCTAALCGWLLFEVTVRVGDNYSPGIRVSVVASLLFVLWTAIAWGLLLSTSGNVLSPAMSQVVALRSIYFLEGLSPLLPVVFVLLAYYLWSLNNLRRLWMVVTRVSLEIPTDNDASRELGGMIDELQASIKRSIYLKPSALALLGLIVAGCCMVRLPAALRGFEPLPFRLWLVSCGFVLLLLIVVAMFYRSWDVWLQLRKVLHFLDTASLGGPFSRVPKELSSTRIWSFGGVRTSLMVQFRTAELLQRMAIKFPEATAMQAAAGGEGTPNASVSSSAQVPEEESPFPILREIARILDSREVLGRPLARKLSALLNTRMPQTAFLFDPETAAPSRLRPGEKNMLELYVAYRFVAFFRYVMCQLRNTVTFVVYGYACLVVGASVYPFQGRESLGTLLSFVFVLLLCGMAAMMVQMYRDPILKRLEEPSGGLSETFEIAIKLVGVAGVPLCAVLASQFPSFAEVLLNWLRPLLEASH